MLENLPKPVIITGSQRPLSTIRTDARGNLINAIELATYAIPEVCIFFHYKLFRGNRAIKVSIDDYNAFISPNYPVIAEVGVNVEISNHFRKPTGVFKLSGNFDERVLVLKIVPSMDHRILDTLGGGDQPIVVLEAFGSGNIPLLNERSIDFVRRMGEAGRLVIISSQCFYGSVDLRIYDSGRRIQEAGAISSGDMTLEATVVKSMYLLGKYNGDVDKVKANFHIPLAGEMSR